MKTKLAVFLAVFLIISSSATLFAEDDFAKTPLGKQLITMGLKFLDDPGDFFFNLHTQNEDFSPLPAGKYAGVRFNFMPTLLPLTWGNLNLKVNVLKDVGYTPQVDLVGMYGDLIGLRMAASSLSDVKPIFTDYSFGAVISKAPNEKTKIFGGVKYSIVQMKVQLSSSSVINFGDFKLEQLDFIYKDTFVFSGIMHETGKDRYVVAQLGYGSTNKKIVSRVMWSRKHLDLGVDVFPEGLFVFHPFMAYHWYF